MVQKLYEITQSDVDSKRDIAGQFNPSKVEVGSGTEKTNIFYDQVAAGGDYIITSEILELGGDIYVISEGDAYIAVHDSASPIIGQKITVENTSDTGEVFIDMTESGRVGGKTSLEVPAETAAVMTYSESVSDGRRGFIQKWSASFVNLTVEEVPEVTQTINVKRNGLDIAGGVTEILSFTDDFAVETLDSTSGRRANISIDPSRIMTDTQITAGTDTKKRLVSPAQVKLAVETHGTGTGANVYEISDEDIANATGTKGLVSGEQLDTLGGGVPVGELTWATPLSYLQGLYPVLPDTISGKTWSHTVASTQGAPGFNVPGVAFEALLPKAGYVEVNLSLTPNGSFFIQAANGLPNMDALSGEPTAEFFLITVTAAGINVKTAVSDVLIPDTVGVTSFGIRAMQLSSKPHILINGVAHEIDMPTYPNYLSISTAFVGPIGDTVSVTFDTASKVHEDPELVSSVFSFDELPVLQHHSSYSNSLSYADQYTLASTSNDVPYLISPKQLNFWFDNQRSLTQEDLDNGTSKLGVVSGEQLATLSSDSGGSTEVPISAYWPLNADLDTPEAVNGNTVTYANNNATVFSFRGLPTSIEYTFQAKFGDVNGNYGGTLLWKLEDNNTGSSPATISYNATTKELKVIDVNGDSLGDVLTVNVDDVVTVSLGVYSGIVYITLNLSGSYYYYNSNIVVPNIEVVVLTSKFKKLNANDELSVAYAWDKKDFFTYVTTSITTLSMAASKNPDLYYDGADSSDIFSYTPSQISDISSGGASQWSKIYTGPLTQPAVVDYLFIDRDMGWDIVVEARVTNPSSSVPPDHSLQLKFTVLAKTFISDVTLDESIDDAGLQGVLLVNAKPDGTLLLSIAIKENPDNLKVDILNIWRRVN